MPSSFKIGKIAGIEIGVHWSWIFILVLITWSFADGILHDAFPEWSQLKGFAVGVVVGVDVSVAVGVIVGVGVIVDAGVIVGVALGVGVAVGVAEAVGVGVTVGVGVGVGVLGFSGCWTLAM